MDRRSFPGISFHIESPAVVEVPRMDIAAFVGFADRGPLHTPVMIEDVPQFDDLFGSIYPLAWDDETATLQTACLAPAVRAFFAQGGRRCWVVRVAGSEATTNHFPLAGMLQTATHGYQAVAATARSAGSWSDALEVGPELLLDSLTFQTGVVQSGAPFELEIVHRQGQPIVPGDVLQLDCDDRRHRAYVAIAAEDLVFSQHLLRVLAHPRRTHWFHRVDEVNLSNLQGTAHTVTVTPSRRASAMLDVESRMLLPVPPGHTLQRDLMAQPGHWLRLKTAQAWLWLLVDEVRAGGLRISSAWFEGFTSLAALQTVARVQRVQLALHVRDRSGNHQVLSDLACAAPHPRFAGYLLDDDALFAPRIGTQVEPDHPAATLWKEIRYPRFPLSLTLPDHAPLIPLGLEQGLAWSRATSTGQDPLARDGLVPTDDDPRTLTGEKWAQFIPQLFLDEGLRNTGQHALLGEANDRLYLQGRRLRGLHSVLPIEEISMIALPDAAHQGWMRVARTQQDFEPPSEPGAEPCDREGPFLSCPPDAVGPGGVRQIVSAEALLDVPQEAQWNLLPSLTYAPNGLVEVQTAAAIVAAARADMVAILGMPKHYRTPDALQHQRQLAASLRQAGQTTSSYVALYHPWVVVREESGTLLHTHPAGVACGVMAARTLARGAWAAPANESVRGILAVTPAPQIGDDAALYGVGINMVWQAGRDFTIWGALTQSAERELEDLNVRRLLILLRRIALREGQSYVFAPHSPGFRHRVKQQFEQVLARLFVRGAFAGRTPSEAYRIVIDETVNTAASVEQGRLVVELRVAPARPLAFITVRLVQADNEFLAVQEVMGNGR